VVGFVTRPLDGLKRVSKAFGEGITINDVVLTAIAGGLRRWLAEEGTPVGELRAKVPVSLHHAGEDVGASANRDSFLVVDLALDQTDPVERLRAISAETQDRKRHHDAEEIHALLDDLARVSRSLERLAERWTMRPRVFAVNVSNVPGPRGDLSLLGAPVREVHSLAEVANRHALRVSAFSAGGMMSFGLCADAGVVLRIDAIASGVEGDLDELRARAS
jgi:diacylglycerol O-acyltransferase / wax synthase